MEGRGQAVDITVSSHPMQRYAVWYGASLLGLSEGFSNIGERALACARLCQCAPSWQHLTDAC